MPWSRMTAKPYSSKLLPNSSATSSSGRAMETDAISDISGDSIRQEQARQRRAHQVGQAARGKCAQAELGDDRALVGREAPRYRHLDGDGTEIGEAAQREGDDRAAAVV